MTEVEISGAPVALYRLYDDQGTLLYVGISGNLRARLASHAKLKPWWPQVARKTVTWHDSEPAARAAETEAIASERPVHNTLEPVNGNSGSRVAPPPGQRHGWNKAPLLGWHPPAELSAWVRQEAERRGVAISVVLNEAVEYYRNTGTMHKRQKEGT